MRAITLILMIAMTLIGAGIRLRALPVASMPAPAAAGPPASPAASQVWHVQTRDARTEAIVPRAEMLDPAKIAVIVIDPWNYHWCMTWTEQAGGMIPRLNQALRGARKLGMPVIWAPTDVASMYSGVPQRERALAVPYVPLPNVRAVTCGFRTPFGPCHCGPGISCLPNYGHDGMPSDIDLADSDYIASGTQEVYSICKKLGITHLIYTGGAVNLCLTGKPEGLVPMYATGIDGWMARDLAEAWTRYDPARGFTSTKGNEASTVDVERAGIPTLHFADELKRRGLWDENAIIEPVRITPAGRPRRPYFFETEVKVTLELPNIPGVEIRYTTDDTEPTAKSTRYEGMLNLTRTTTLRACGFKDGKRVAIETSGYWVKLPAVPAKPEVYLDQVKALPDLYGQVNAATYACLWHPTTNVSYEGRPLRIRGHTYEKGLGMRAPAYARYELRPEWKRFVALAGVADNLLDAELGRNIASHPSVNFNIYIDGKLAGQSPVMRISQAPWRFDVPIPAGSRIITLSATDAGDRSPYDLANWVEAGFVTK